MPPYPLPGWRLPGLAATLAVHLALLLCWQLSRHQAVTESRPVRTIQWVNVMPSKKVEPPVAAPSPRAPIMAKKRVQDRLAAVPPVRVQEEAPAQTVPQQAAEAAPSKSAHDILQQARRDLGAINKELSKEFPGQKIKAPPDTAQTRLEKGIELAHDLAPPKWYEGPKIKELVDPGGYGRKRYRVITAKGTYCITYESNHAPDGIDVIRKGMQQKLTTCPKDELPPTTQKGL